MTKRNLSFHILKTIILSSFMTVTMAALARNSPKSDNPLKVKIDSLKVTMLAFLQSRPAVYTKTEVEQCANILYEYVDSMQTCVDKDAGLNIVKNSIIALNELNAKCGFQLIESEERDQIVDIIITACSQKGFCSKEGDITEEWRQW